MSAEFRRLLDDRACSPLHAVLEAGLRDRPSRRHLALTARALGVGAAGLGAAQAAAAAQTSRAVHASSWAALAKWGAAGLLLGGAALSPLVLSTRAERAAGAVQSAPQRALPTAPLAAPDTLAYASPAPQTQTPAMAEPQATSSAKTAAPLPEAATAPEFVTKPPTGSFPLAAAPAAVPHAVPASNLDTEVALLDAARSALKQRAPDTALIWLDRHARLSAPSLALEATLLRVQALVAAGRVLEAQASARRAIGNANGSTYALRLSKLAGLTDRQ